MKDHKLNYLQGADRELRRVLKYIQANKPLKLGVLIFFGIFSAEI